MSMHVQPNTEAYSPCLMCWYELGENLQTCPKLAVIEPPANLLVAAANKEKAGFTGRIEMGFLTVQRTRPISI